MSRPTTGPRPRHLTVDRSGEESAEYMRARRSVFISPVDPSLAGVKKYICEQLGMPSEVVEDLEIGDICSIHPKKIPMHRKETTETKKTHISMRDSYERYLIISYTSNLQFPSRLDIVVPEYLQPLKAKLEGLAYKIRKHAKESSDKKVMTSLRLDDKTESLTMAVRENKEDPWLHYTFQELIEDANKRRKEQGKKTVPGRTKRKARLVEDIKLNRALINCRSVKYKLKFLSECFKVNKLDLALLNETWLYRSDPQASKLLYDFKNDHNIELIRKDRDSRGGVVAVAYNVNNLSLKKLNLASLKAKKFEILACRGKIKKCNKELTIFSCSLTPKLNKSESMAFLMS